VRNDYQLRRWLMREILGKEIPRKPPKRATHLSGNKPARDWKYRAWIRSLPSAVSGVIPCEECPIEACHTGTDGGTAEKSSDYSCIPLTWEEHCEYHQIGRAAFEQRHNLNIRALVRRLNHCWWNQWRISL